jgi:hypothetical protein
MKIKIKIKIPQIPKSQMQMCKSASKKNENQTLIISTMKIYNDRGAYVKIIKTKKVN